MNANQIFRLVQRLFLRRLMRKGINAGIDYAARRGKSASEMTPEERNQAQQGKAMAGRAKKLGRLARRIGRF